MLYAVYCEFGFVGVFTSLEVIQQLVFDLYPDTKFIIYVFSNCIYDDTNNYVWIVYFKNTEIIAYLSQNREDAERALKTLQIIDKAYEDSIDHWKLELNTIPDIVNNILKIHNRYMKEKNNEVINNMDNIIIY